MITENDLKEAIVECQGVRNPNASTCMKLAAFYIIKDHLYSEGVERAKEEINNYSFSSGPNHTILNEKGGEFSDAVNGKDTSKVWEIMNELMECLKVINPRLFNGVIRQLKQLD